MLLVLHNVTMVSLRTFARKVAADDETWRNNNQTWARANFSFFIYFLFQIKWHFEFFLLKNGGWISTLSTPPVSAPAVTVFSFDHINSPFIMFVDPAFDPAQVLSRNMHDKILASLWWFSGPRFDGRKCQVVALGKSQEWRWIYCLHNVFQTICWHDWPGLVLYDW